MHFMYGCVLYTRKYGYSAGTIEEECERCTIERWLSMIAVVAVFSLRTEPYV